MARVATPHSVGRKVVPYGLLFAPRFYLVALIKSKAEPVLFRLDRMHDLEVTDEPGAPPESFDLEAYASRSFGVFQEEAEDIVLRFDPAAAPDARTYLFHPTQTMIDEADGSLAVRFRAAGLLQIAHHLMTGDPRWRFLRQIGSRYWCGRRSRLYTCTIARCDGDLARRGQRPNDRCVFFQKAKEPSVGIFWVGQTSAERLDFCPPAVRSKPPSPMATTSHFRTATLAAIRRRNLAQLGRPNIFAEALNPPAEP
jgi:hypothetical protein